MRKVVYRDTEVIGFGLEVRQNSATYYYYLTQPHDLGSLGGDGGRLISKGHVIKDDLLGDFSRQPILTHLKSFFPALQHGDGQIWTAMFHLDIPEGAGTEAPAVDVSPQTRGSAGRG